MLPDQFEGIESKEKLLVELKLAALLSGVPLVVWSSQPPKAGVKSEQVLTVKKLVCSKNSKC